MPEAQRHICINHLPHPAHFSAEHILAVPIPRMRTIYTSFPDAGSDTLYKHNIWYFDPLVPIIALQYSIRGINLSD